MPNEHIFNALLESYPEIDGTKLFNCTTCHTRSKWLRNSYGFDLQEYLRGQYATQITAEEYTQAMIVGGMKAIENRDSDGDGFTNLEEFEAGTFPGDAEDFPEAVETTGE